MDGFSTGEEWQHGVALALRYRGCNTPFGACDDDAPTLAGVSGVGAVAFLYRPLLRRTAMSAADRGEALIGRQEDPRNLRDAALERKRLDG